MLIEGDELFMLLALIVMSNEGLDGAKANILERHFLLFMKNELLDEFVRFIRVAHHQFGISGEKQHAVVTRLSAQRIFF